MTELHLSAVAIFTASLLGSLHCACMCGGFVVFLAGQSGGSLLAHTAYNLGRAITYICFGLLAGYLGGKLNSLSGFVGLQQASAVLVGGFFLLWGVLHIARIRPFGRLLAAQGRIYGKALGELRAKLLNGPRQRPALFGLGLGLVTTFLPCGWLYAFVAIAAAQAEPMLSAQIMFWFWLGTVPVMLLSGKLSSFATKKLGSLYPTLTGVLLVCAGLFALLYHQDILPMPMGTEDHAHHHHH